MRLFQIFYFTGTGNSLYIAKRFKGEFYSIPQVLRGEEFNFEDEKIGIIFPTYGFSIPNIVLDFIEKISLKSPYIFAIMTCGNNNGNATKYFASVAKKHNIEIKYCNKIAMTGNHIPIVDINEQMGIDKNIEENINLLLDDVENNREYINNGMLAGGVLKNALKLVQTVKKLDSPENFSVNESCIKCSTCIKVCSRANVSYDESRNIIFGNRCENCLACVHNCPKKAIQVKGDKNSDARFRNENISLKEIIESNNQKVGK